MKSNDNPKEVVLSYIKALDGQDYDAAGSYLNDDVRVHGPAGEMFSKPKEFIGMLRPYRGKYEVKKVFTDGKDVCVLYDFVTSAAKVFMCSWYQVEDGRITSVRSVFDPRPFASVSAERNSEG